MSRARAHIVNNDNYIIIYTVFLFLFNFFVVSCLYSITVVTNNYNMSYESQLQSRVTGSPPFLPFLCVGECSACVLLIKKDGRINTSAGER